MDERYIPAKEMGIKPGTIGYELIFDTEKQIPLIDYKTSWDSYTPELDFLNESEQPNTDDILRELGFYDSTDKRSCINRKRR